MSRRRNEIADRAGGTRYMAAGLHEVVAVTFSPESTTSEKQLDDMQHRLCQMIGDRNNTIAALRAEVFALRDQQAKALATIGYDTDELYRLKQEVAALKAKLTETHMHLEFELTKVCNAEDEAQCLLAQLAQRDEDEAVGIGLRLEGYKEVVIRHYPERIEFTDPYDACYLVYTGKLDERHNWVYGDEQSAPTLKEAMQGAGLLPAKAATP